MLLVKAFLVNSLSLYNKKYMLKDSIYYQDRQIQLSYCL